MDADEFVLDTRVVRDFVAEVKTAIQTAVSPEDARVRTTSAETSVSIHLLTNDTGCVWRHAYAQDSGEQRPFRSGYVNVPCKDG